MVPTALSDLERAVQGIVDSIAKASSSLDTAGVKSEDIPLISEQGDRAVVTVSDLQSVLGGAGPRDEGFVLLHRLNNQLTGILSLTLLLVDDLGPAHTCRSPLESVETSARTATGVVKTLASMLRNSAA